MATATITPGSVPNPGPANRHAENNYATQRGQLVAELQAQSFCSGVQLSTAEINVDRWLGRVRADETAHFVAAASFPPSQMFFHARPGIESSRLFPIFQRMPKGGLLHLHESSCGRCEFVLAHIVRRADCFIWWSDDARDGQRGRLKFSPMPPGDDGAITGFFRFEDLEERLRARGGVLREELRRRYMLDATDAAAGDIWAAFAAWFDLMAELLRYRPVMREYLRDAFQTLHEDGIGHVELRVVTPVATLYDFSGGAVVNYPERETLQEYLAARDFIRDRFNPHFTLRLILCGLRGNATSDAATVLAKVREYGEYFPGENLIAGCDFVGNEDGGRPTLAEVATIRAAATQTVPPTQFYFHAGETAWTGNDNLVDAVLLGTKRVGHGFNLFQLPAVETMMKQNRIALEICPISNQLLRLSPDLRTHPALGYLNRGLQCVLGSDDPAIFGNTGLTYDFWEAFYAWGLDLRGLKQLAKNSLTFSALEPVEKSAALARWNDQWNDWVRWVETQST